MNKTFIFDLDGVMIDDEQMWEDKKQQLFLDFFGEKVTAKMGLTSGVSMQGIYEMALAAGANVNKQELFDAFFSLATDIYKTAPISKGLEELVTELLKMQCVLAIVSSSPMAWITTVTKRLPFESDITLIISLYERSDLKHKPAPDGYIEAMKALETTPDHTVVLEDSNSGIKSAKTSGAYTIGLKQNLVTGYEQEGADVYAATMVDVLGIVRERFTSPL